MTVNYALLFLAYSFRLPRAEHVDPSKTGTTRHKMPAPPASAIHRLDTGITLPLSTVPDIILVLRLGD